MTAASITSVRPLSALKILLAHSNHGAIFRQWHERRRRAAVALGYDLSLFNLAERHPYRIFPQLDRLWRKRDPELMKLYDELGASIDACDVFIHYNGALIHPRFLEQFRKLTIYHCADDPDASEVLSRPVAPHYDICAISNPACIAMYESWGCRDTFFWPLGSFSYEDDDSAPPPPESADRDVPLVFIGSKLGVTNVRFIGKYLGLYQKTRFMNKIERAFPELVAYGAGWSRGRVADDQVAALYRRSRVGFNVHNTLGPVNGRLYDLAAFGVCQICDNKPTLSLVFEEGSEIVGFQTARECIASIRHFLAHHEEAARIGNAARARFQRDYTTTAIWKKFFDQVERIRSRGR